MTTPTQVLAQVVALYFLAAVPMIAVAAGPSTAPATGPAAKVERASLWGNAVDGLQARLLAPAEVEQDDLIPLRFEIAADPDHLPPGVDGFDTFLLPTRVDVSMTNVKTGKTVAVGPLVPTNGIPTKNTGGDFVLLDAKPIKSFAVEVALRTAVTPVEPGDYECVLRYPSGRAPPAWALDVLPPTPERFWHGKWETAPLRVRVRAQSLKTLRLPVPKRVHLDADHVLRCDKEVIEAVDVPIRNGCFLGTRIRRIGGAEMLAGGFSLPAEGGVVFDDPTTDADAKVQPGDEVTYAVEVFETEKPPEHIWLPTPGLDGYKTLWKRAYQTNP